MKSTVAAALLVLVGRLLAVDAANEIVTAKRGGVVHVGASRATLLSGALYECRTYGDPTCSGGVQAVDAYARYLGKEYLPMEQREPFVVVPFLDVTSPFANMNSYGLGINIMVLGWLMFVSLPSLSCRPDIIQLSSSHPDIHACILTAVLRCALWPN